MDLEKTGIPGLDEILKGGLRKNCSILIKGASGTGKTVLALQFIIEGAKRNLPGVFITAEEELTDLREYAKSLGIDIAKYEKKKLVYLIKQPVTLKKLISIAIPLQLISKAKIKRVVLDSLTLFRYGTENKTSYRKEILDLKNNMRNVSFLAISEERKEGEIDNFNSGAEDYLFDGIIRMTKIRKGNNFERCLFIAKMRGQEHSLDIFPFSITEKGIVIHHKELPFSLLESSSQDKK